MPLLLLAKVYRDKLMIKISKKFIRTINWNKNFGYGTKSNIYPLGLRKNIGLTTMHRKNFKPIYKMLLK